MENQNSLRVEIKKEILQVSTNFADFSRLSGLNRGIFSSIFNASPPKPIALTQLEAISKALHKEDRWLFELYVEECFFNGKPNRRRIEPFLIRCAELGKFDCINQVLLRLKEDSKYIEMIFEISEKLHLSGKIAEALRFYEFIVNNAYGLHLEALAISHYRIFCASISKEHEKNLRITLRFEPYCDYLPIHYQLDALMTLVDIHYSLVECEEGNNKWRSTERCSKKLFLLSDQVYQNIKAQKRSGHEPFPLPLKKPLVVYYGYSLLTMGNIMLNQEKFEQAYAYVAMYEDLNWFEELDEKGKVQVARFSMFAKLNYYNLEILEGNIDAVEKCMNLVEEYPNEILSILINFLNAFNKHGFKIKTYTDLLLKKFEEKGLSAISPKNEVIKNRYFLELHYQQSLYYLQENNLEKAFVAMKKASQIAVEINALDKHKAYLLLFDLIEKKLNLASSN